MGAFIGFAFAYCPFLVPVRKLRQNAYAVSFKHPAPSYPNHVLIIPRKIASDVFKLSASDFVKIISLALEIKGNDTHDYSLIINGGDRQDVKQAHFHLLTGNTAAQKSLPKEKAHPFEPYDKEFWINFTLNLHKLLEKHEISEDAFSILISLENNATPEVYFM
jgi:diadenosine tetraphosphate (Ap4A) HIT family hydrolase